MIRTRVASSVPGLALCGVIAFIAFCLGELSWLRSYGLSALTVAIMVGMVIGNTYYKNVDTLLAPGVDLSKKTLLRLGIILYGFRLTLQDVASVGFEGVTSDALVLCSTFLLALLVGIKLFKLTPGSVVLIGAGSSICGAAAVMAAEGEVDATAEDVSVAISTVVVFGSVAIFLYPYLYELNLTANWIASNNVAFGIYAGSTIHEVAQVVAAGLSISPAVSDVAVITKMVRVMMLAPFLLLLPLFFTGKSTSSESTKKSAFPIPWFALLFIAMTVLNSTQILPAQLVKVVVHIDTLLLAMAMAALGLTTHLSAVRKSGVKPLLLALILFIWLIVGGALINRFVFWL
ncbi:MAG: YeiH family putative sulfate export transporter [Solimicrobium sp.]|jgi:uncharacterized integral membrane protein (TIGR00698 family)|nr:YeiH family putative sulfate export transporter [Solimicrobium sp.]